MYNIKYDNRSKKLTIIENPELITGVSIMTTFSKIFNVDFINLSDTHNKNVIDMLDHVMGNKNMYKLFHDKLTNISNSNKNIYSLKFTFSDITEKEFKQFRLRLSLAKETITC